MTVVPCVSTTPAPAPLPGPTGLSFGRTGARAATGRVIGCPLRSSRPQRSPANSISILLSAALAIAARRIRIDALHTLEQITGIGSLHIGFTGPVAIAAFTQRIGRRGRHLTSFFSAKNRVHYVLSFSAPCEAGSSGNGKKLLEQRSKRDAGQAQVGPFGNGSGLYPVAGTTLNDCQGVFQRFHAGELIVQILNIVVDKRVHIEQEIFLFVLEGDSIPADATHRRAEPVDEQSANKGACIGGRAGARRLHPRL